MSKPKIKTDDLVVLPAESQLCVEVKTKLEGLTSVFPIRLTYQNHFCLASTAVAQVKQDEHFRILLANVKTPKILLPNQHITYAEDRPSTLVG